MTRTITTAAELDALPWGAVVARTIFGEPGEDWHKRRDGMWLGTGGDVWAADLLAVASDHAHMALTLVAPVVPVVSDAAVEAFKAAWHRADAEGRAGERVRDALTAALPFLGAAPSAPACAGCGLAQREHQPGYAASRCAYTPAAAPSATREASAGEVAETVTEALTDAHREERGMSRHRGLTFEDESVIRDRAACVIDLVTARFTITPRTDR